MPEYMHLIGAEDVRAGGNSMLTAADTMRQAAREITEAVERMGRLLEAHTSHLEAVLKAEEITE